MIIGPDRNYRRLIDVNLLHIQYEGILVDDGNNPVNIGFSYCSDLNLLRHPSKIVGGCECHGWVDHSATGTHLVSCW